MSEVRKLVERAKVFKTDVLGVGPWCVEFADGEIVTTRSEDRAHRIATLEAALSAAAAPDDYDAPERRQARDLVTSVMAFMNGAVNALPDDCAEIIRHWQKVAAPARDGVCEALELLESYYAQHKWEHGCDAEPCDKCIRVIQLLAKEQADGQG